MEKQTNKHYLTNKEIREIAKENLRQMKKYEKAKKAKLPESAYVTEMKRDDTILEIDNLHTYFFTESGVSKAVNGVSFDIPQGSVVGVVGESGCGKSVTSLAIMRLVQGPQGQIVNGSIRFKSTALVTGEDGKPVPVYEKDENGEIIYDEVTAKNGNVKTDAEGKPVLKPRQKTGDHGFPVFETEPKVFDIAKMPINEMRRLRGKEIAMIFQEPMTSLNPVFTIGNQLDEAILVNNPGVTNEQAKAHSIHMLEQVGIAMPEAVYKKFPHELSGGMRQRVMIAMALAGHPRLLIADEPTTALDTTTQKQILDLLRDLNRTENMAVLFISHDLGVVTSICSRVHVMYLGQIVEEIDACGLMERPSHPYAQGLIASIPPLEGERVDTLADIPGTVPPLTAIPCGCRFAPRCARADERCRAQEPPLFVVNACDRSKCWLVEKGERHGC